MPKVKIESESKHSAADTFNKIRKMLENDKDLQKMDPGYSCHFDDKNLRGTAKGSKFEANMIITAKGPGSFVEIEVSLPMLLTPVKGVVQSTLQKKVAVALA